MPIEIDGEVYPDLPTVEECREFLRLVNVGRVASGRNALEVLNFDDASPESPIYCLSATNLFVVNGHGRVGGVAANTTPEVVEALGMKRSTRETEPGFFIPAEILKVTDPFDARTPGLRERLVEAGVVAP